ncbi:hypothetical protein Ahy_Scaffold1g106692 isoform C [Arachis hypogaea]|uniref:3-epi-6-deoxocathasterone 23-monooxygenase n=1 Tax=Arachis hypogaea TaxID=3818 RepID=A0A444WRD3_ARAHY|nr:hypothetical protein Ahy_Scaffold1g106692 isoform C [Arachis hypogaea]
MNPKPPRVTAYDLVVGIYSQREHHKQDMAWMIVTGVIICFITSLCWWLLRENNKKKKKKKVVRKGKVPEGRWGWPIIGETLDFIASGYTSQPQPLTFLEKRKSMYGNVFKTSILGSSVIVSTEVEVNKVVLMNQGNMFVPAYPKSIRELMGEHSILHMNGTLHRKMHALIGGFLRSPHLKARITTDIERAVKQCLATWTSHQSIYVQDQVKMAKERMVKIVKRIIEERKKKKKEKASNEEEKDVVDVVLGNEWNPELTLEMMSSNIIEMMIPGEETLPTAMTIALFFLSNSPLALSKLREENMQLKRQKSSSPNSSDEYAWTDYMSLQFTQNVISETLRMANIVNGIWRKAVKDVEIKGYLIPKGWCVMASLTSVHLDSNNYENPFKFDPWRWEKIGAAASNNCFTPFGGGQRLCPGLELSRLELSIFLHHLVTTYRWVAETDEIIYFPTVKMKRKLPISVEPINA